MASKVSTAVSDAAFRMIRAVTGTISLAWAAANPRMAARRSATQGPA